jgi:hypothetical protein
MRKLVLILIAFIAAVTLIRALEAGNNPAGIAVETPGTELNLGR